MRRWFVMCAAMISAAAVVFVLRHHRGATKPPLPVAESANVAAQMPTTTSDTNAVSTLPPSKNLAVPFTTQAPNANWDADHEEFCEEAATLMVQRYYAGKNFSGPTDAEQALQALKQWELDHLGFFQDTTAAQTLSLALGTDATLRGRLLPNPSAGDIQKEIAAGHPVIVPTAGRALGNPHFSGQGPLYHMLVIKGYTKTSFITNDPGTRVGADYLYPFSTVMKAVHDWNGGDVAHGQAVAIVLTASR